MRRFHAAALAAVLAALTPVGVSQAQTAPQPAQATPPAPAAGAAQGQAPQATPVPASGQPDGEVLDLPAGARAPWAGMLLRQADLARWMLRIRDLQWQLDHEVQLAEQRATLQLQQAQVDTRLAEERLTLHDQAFAAEREDWRNRLTRETRREEEMHARARKRLVSGLAVAGMVLVAGFVGGFVVGVRH